MTETPDWRLRRQDEMLSGVELRLETYGRYSETWDHDHCDFCFGKFLPPGQIDEHRRLASDDDHELFTEGYTTTESYESGANCVWICTGCFSDFDELISWVVVCTPRSYRLWAGVVGDAVVAVGLLVGVDVDSHGDRGSEVMQ